jgi:kynurenine formamidase
LPTELVNLLRAARVFDLAQPYYVGMPHHPNHPPFLYGLSKKHGDFTGPGGVSSASESIALGGHVGTHIDALCHFSAGGKLHGGTEAAGVQSYAAGLGRDAVDSIAPMLRRGVLLDIAGHEGLPALPEDYEITPATLDAVSHSQRAWLEPGDVALLRTGWGRYWDDAPRFVNQSRGPGPGPAGARWLSRAGVFAAGSDTVAFELVPSPSMPAHVHLLVECGIHILECLNLEELAAARVHEFLFVAAPLNIRGGTGAPIRPLALVEAQP